MYGIRRPSGPGFSLVEMLIALAIMGILMAIAVPAYKDWVISTRVKGAAEFYLEGLRTARYEAIKHNSSSRLMMLDNSDTGQFDWRIDLCFRSDVVACDKTATGWSTETAGASGDPDTVKPFKSKFRSSQSMPKATTMDQELTPAGATDVYFMSNGWINTTVSPRLTRLTLSPVAAGAFRPVAVSLTLGGVAASCDPNVVSPDSRACP